MLCDIVTFIASETTSTTQALLKQKSKIHVKEEKKLDMPTVKKVTRRSKEHQQDHEVISLKKVGKILCEEPPTEERPLLQKFEKTEIGREEMVYSKAVTEIKLTSSYEVTEDTWSYETATKTEKISKGEEKKTEQYKDVREKKGIAPEIVGREVENKGKQGSKILMEDEPTIPLKKATKSISTEKEQETVKLKPVEKLDKVVVDPQKDSNIDRSKDSIGVQKHERLIMDEPVSKKEIDATPTDQKTKEPIIPKPVVAKDELSKEHDKFPKKAKRIIPHDEKPETVTLKPFSKESHADVATDMVPQEQTEKKPVDIKHPGRPETTHILKEPHIQVKEPEKSEKTYEEAEKIKKLESPHEYQPMKSTTSPEKIREDSKEKGKGITKKHRIIPTDEMRKEEVLLKPVEGKIIAEKTPSPKIDKPSPQVTPLTKKSPKEEDKAAMANKFGLSPKEMEREEEISLKPIEPAELKKTPSPKVDIQKLKPTESIPMERKSSAKSPKKISPKDSLESVILKKVSKTVTPKEENTTQEPPLKTTEDKLSMVKELSPSVLHLQKIPTQQEEVVYEQEQELVVGEEEETWGWELAPRESYGSETFDDTLEDGAVETPGMGDKKGEMVASKAHRWYLLAPYNRSKIISTQLIIRYYPLTSVFIFKCLVVFDVVCLSFDSLIISFLVHQTLLRKFCVSVKSCSVM